MKIAVYTCVTGSYDPIRPPLVESEDVDYFCFTEPGVELPCPWQRGVIPRPDLSPKHQNRFCKMHPHLLPEIKDYDVSLYIDGSIQIVGDVRALIESQLLESEEGVWIYDHPYRQCAYKEGRLCAYFAHDWIWNITKQMRRYNQEGFPENYGLSEAGVLLRTHKSWLVQQLMALWWEEYKQGAARDQLALPYVSWRSGVPIRSLGRSDPRFDQDFFRFIHHPRRILFSTNLRKYINRAALACFNYDRSIGFR